MITIDRLPLKREPTGQKPFQLAIAALALTSLIFSIQLFVNEKDHVLKGYGDFVIFYTGAEILKAGLGDKLYDPVIQKTFQDKFDVSIRVGPLLFNHPPFELLLFLPLSYLSYPVAYGTWSLINLLLLVGSMWLLAPRLDRGLIGTVCLMVLGFFPTFVTFLYGQDSILSTFLVAAAFTTLKKQRDTAAGALLSLALYKPQLVFPIFAILLFKGRWAALKGLCFGAFVLAGVSIAMVGFQGLKEFTNLVAKMNETRYTIVPANMPNLRGFLESFIVTQNSSLAFFAVVVLSLALLIFLLFSWRGEYRPDAALFDLKFSLAVVGTLMMSYHLYLHDLTLLTVPIALTLNYLLMEATNSSATRIVFLWLVVVLWLPFPLTYLPLLRHEQMSSGFLILLVLAILLAAEIKPRGTVPGKLTHLDNRGCQRSV